MPPDVAAWLAATRFACWAAAPLAGDASTRRYWRLTGPSGGGVILMQAPPKSLPPFLRIAGHLTGLGLTAPEPLEVAGAQGLAIFTDLGPEHVAARLARLPGDEAVIYAAASDLLAQLTATAPPANLPRIGPSEAGQMLAPFISHYAPPGAETERLAEALTGLWRRLDLAATHFALRDFHAENLIWRPEAVGAARLGLLDFQDAVLAPAEYDLTSLITDARRALAPGLAAALTTRFAAATGAVPAETEARVAAISLARNLRILGIFARLAREQGKRRYLALLPRVQDHVAEALAHPALADLVSLVRAAAPPPDAALLARLEGA